MARRRRRPWYRRRAYRLARTAVLTVVLVTAGHRIVHREGHGAGTAAPAPEPRTVAAGDARPGATGPATAPTPSPSPRPRTTRTATPAPRPAGTSAPPRTLPRSPATRIVIPYIGVDADLMDLALDSERRLTTPPEDKPELAGWYTDGPSPGEPGTAIAVGHLDTNTGPAVFGGLGELKRGKRVEVRRADGRTAVYTVDAIKSYEKDKFPNRLVYGTRNRPELRLITCGGNYDRRTGYSGNVVVFAHLTGTREPARKG
ncbi:class F sortase [Streptomyces sp. NRRL WC-3604]|uniref:class F sortase n=1 Tax=unclassified Streptomyces TaxID=2593676 RepID=UPI00074965A6|nr:class F sortase [Streptomyces sp. NRRL WC-3604]KUL72682.1 peptidase C60 [Streptomyces sp. NRRL WC-3604]